MAEQIEVTGVLPGSPAVVYAAWMDGVQHAAMTGAAAEVDPRVGGVFSAWDGYISGTHLELVPGVRIVQAWRSSEFPDGSPDSRLEIVLEAVGQNTRITLRHSNIPDGQGRAYEQGWYEFYLEPMTAYLARPSSAAGPSGRKARLHAARSRASGKARPASAPRTSAKAAAPSRSSGRVGKAAAPSRSSGRVGKAAAPSRTSARKARSRSARPR